MIFDILHGLPLACLGTPQFLLAMTKRHMSFTTKVRKNKTKQNRPSQQTRFKTTNRGGCNKKQKGQFLGHWMSPV